MSMSRGDQSVLGQDANWISEFREDFQTAARDSQFALDRLITIGHAAHHQETAASISVKTTLLRVIVARPVSP